MHSCTKYKQFQIKMVNCLNRYTEKRNSRSYYILPNLKFNPENFQPCLNQKLIFLLQTKAHAVGPLKNRLNETVPLGTQTYIITDG